MRPPTCVVFQLSFVATVALLASWIPSVGLARASAIPKGTNDGPIARTRIFLVEPAGPCTMKPSINALSPVPTGRRVETLPTKPGVPAGVGVGVGASALVRRARQMRVDPLYLLKIPPNRS